MKSGKAAGFSGIIAEMTKESGDKGILLRMLTEPIIVSGSVPKDWEESYILNLYKGKGVALDCCNYHCRKLPDQVVEQVLKVKIQEMMNIDKNAVWCND